MSSFTSLNLRLINLGFPKTPKRRWSSVQSRIEIPISSLLRRQLSYGLKFCGSQGKCHRSMMHWRNMVLPGATDEDSMGSFSFNEWENSDGISGDSSYILSSSGEDSDTELLINPVVERDFSGINDNFSSSDGALSMTHHLAMLRKRRKTNRIQPGLFINTGLIAFLVMLLLLVDCCSWRIVRLPLPPFYFTRPFLISAVLASCLGYLCIPLFNSLRIHQFFRKEGPVTHRRKKGTPTMGGLFFIPVGITIAIAIAGPSAAVFGAAVATIAFGAIGLLDDLFSSSRKHNYGLPACIKVLLEVAVGIWFSFWLNATNITSPYSMKTVVPLPAPLGLVCLGKLYPILTTFTFVSMGNGINLTDGLDGLAGGTAALAFIGMSIAVLPISSDLAIFGASMAGACIGFLVHNRFRASIFMGDTGSLALGGALAAMAACTGMFFPLFISSGIFVLEALSVIMQVLYFKGTKCWYGAGRRLFRMSPLHHHLELCGFREPLIVASTYIISYILSIFAGYMGLISA